MKSGGKRDACRPRHLAFQTVFRRLLAAGYLVFIVFFNGKL
jgi:hypothetical protein